MNSLMPGSCGLSLNAWSVAPALQVPVLGSYFAAPAAAEPPAGGCRRFVAVGGSAGSCGCNACDQSVLGNVEYVTMSHAPYSRPPPPLQMMMRSRARVQRRRMTSTPRQRRRPHSGWAAKAAALPPMAPASCSRCSRRPARLLLHSSVNPARQARQRAAAWRSSLRWARRRMGRPRLRRSVLRLARTVAASPAALRTTTCWRCCGRARWRPTRHAASRGPAHPAC